MHCQANLWCITTIPLAVVQWSTYLKGTAPGDVMGSCSSATDVTLSNVFIGGGGITAAGKNIVAASAFPATAITSNASMATWIVAENDDKGWLYLASIVVTCSSGQLSMYITSTGWSAAVPAPGILTQVATLPTC